jgi:hypothetical protein
MGRVDIACEWFLLNALVQQGVCSNHALSRNISYGSNDNCRDTFLKKNKIKIKSDSLELEIILLFQQHRIKFSVSAD